MAGLDEMTFSPNYCYPKLCELILNSVHPGFCYELKMKFENCKLSFCSEIQLFYLSTISIDAFKETKFWELN